MGKPAQDRSPVRHSPARLIRVLTLATIAVIGLPAITRALELPAAFQDHVHDYEPHAAMCIGEGERGIWQPWLDYDESSVQVEWRALEADAEVFSEGCSFGGRLVDDGPMLDLGLVPLGDHSISALLRLNSDPATFTGIVWEITNPLPGDVNLDQVVDFNDFAIFTNRFGEPGTWTDGDMDYDGVVQFTDFLILVNNYGVEAEQEMVADPNAAAAIPEPASWLLAVLALCSLAKCRRTRPKIENYMPASASSPS